MSEREEKLEQLSPLQRAFLKIEELKEQLQQAEESRHEPIAIVGLACRFPGGANTPDAFWQLLEEGVDGISEVSNMRWDREHLYDANPDKPGKMSTKWGGYMDSIEKFDPYFFNIAPGEVYHMDPQHRQLLMTTYEALENANIPSNVLANSKTGVFVGIGGTDYGFHLTKHVQQDQIGPYLGSGNSLSGAAGRLSYFFGWHGPCMSIDTACSSSLVSIHNACQSLRNEESEVALAGGVNLILSPDVQISLSKAGMMAPDGRCKTFDAAANGYVRSDGCGMVVLKKLSDALEDEDTIWALIRGSAIAQDGRSGGLTVPNAGAQEMVIREAQQRAGITSDAIDYIEAHGTGTSLGDPVEIDSLAAVMQGRDGHDPLRIGSVKTNIGHLEAAAGVAGLSKVVLALQHEKIPPHLHFKNPNPLISWDKAPVKVNDTLTDWSKSEDRVRLAGLSSFGFTGTIGHMVIEEAPELEEEEIIKPTDSLGLLVLSAKTTQALKDLAQSYTDFLSNTTNQWSDICYTSIAGRDQYEYRLAFVAANKDQAVQQLKAYLNNEQAPNSWNGSASQQSSTVLGMDDEGHFTVGEQRAEQWTLKQEELAKQFVQGHDLIWDFGAELSPYKKITLPNYPFQLERFWIDRQTTQNFLDENIYNIQWKEVSLTQEKDAGLIGQWLLISQSEEVAETFLAVVSNGVVVKWGDTYLQNDRRFTVDPVQAEHFISLLQGLKDFGVTLKGAIHHWQPAQPEALDTDLAGTLHLTQAIVNGSDNTLEKLILISSNAQPIGDAAVLDAFHAPLWGLGRTIALEHNELSVALVDIDRGSHLSSPTLAQLLTDQTNDQLALRKEKYYTPVLEKAFVEATNLKAVKVGGTYLVTGGLGSLGLGAAQWLADQGAQHLILLSRNGLPDREHWDGDDLSETIKHRIEQVKQIEQSGTTVHPWKADVASRQQMQAVFDRMANEGFNIKGVVHAAGTTSHHYVKELPLEDLYAVMQSKVWGTQILHELTSDLSLDIFLMYSSISSTWGSGLLAHYSAANAFMDTMAHHRKAQGLPALSINWGAWKDSAMVQQGNSSEVLAEKGVQLLDPAVVYQHFDDLLATDAANLVVTPVDWSQFIPLMELKQPRHFWDSLRVELGTEVEGEVSTILQDLLAANGHAQEILTQYLQQEVSLIMGFPNPKKLDIKRPFNELGIDSIMVVKLTRKLERDLKLSLSTNLLFNYPTINDLCEYLLEDELQIQTTSTADTSDAFDIEKVGLADIDEDELRKMINEDLNKMEGHGN